jgi:hypothetical protein
MLSCEAMRLRCARLVRPSRVLCSRQYMRSALPLVVFASVAFSQGIITTAVGTDPTFQDNGQPAIQARIGLRGFSDYDNLQVYKVGSDGIMRPSFPALGLREKRLDCF